MTTHSSLLTWRVLWTEEPRGPQSMGLQSRIWLSMHALTESQFTEIPSCLEPNQHWKPSGILSLLVPFPHLRFSPLPQEGDIQREALGNSRERGMHVPEGTWKRIKLFSVNWNTSKEFTLCLECQLNRVLRRGIFRITCLYLCTYHVILKVHREMPSERQIYPTFPILQLNIPTVTCLLSTSYKGI